MMPDFKIAIQIVNMATGEEDADFTVYDTDRDYCIELAIQHLRIEHRASPAKAITLPEDKAFKQKLVDELGGL